MKITFKGCNPSNYRKGREFPINWICLHFTANNGDTAQNNADYFAREVVEASAHYFVDPNEIYQSVKDSDTAWHCGRERGGSYYNDCRNANSIGIEMCSVIRNGVYVIPEETMKRAAKLTRELMAKYRVPISRVCRHYDVTHKDCPEPWVRNPQLWEKFLAMLTEKEDEELVKSKKVLLNGKAYDCECIDKNDVNYIKMRSLQQAGFNVVYDAIRQQPSITAPQSRTFVPDCTAEVQEAVDILRENVGLEQQTIEYLRRYQWGDELVKKIAKAVK
ncbi:N-acetylmuramoyl-L-alanine amidase family protein [Agathobaculum sp.]|jgi:N-acetylmuramoyl-L-alanine amidase CwlA|uniref:peptidoglycan recognition protein family protein n=1 Tax=Agathobaculum sp. TaxID=2048138 RepID=UPI0035228B74